MRRRSEEGAQNGHRRLGASALEFGLGSWGRGGVMIAPTSEEADPYNLGY
jgi:hypothetical protein